MSASKPLVFYDFVLAYFPARVRLLLSEKGLPYQHNHLNVLKCDNLKIEFAKINPKMTVILVVAAWAYASGWTLAPR